jgi:hypothetical protein
VNTLHKGDDEDEDDDDHDDIESTFKKDIKEIDPRIAYKYLQIEESHGIQYKNEKEKLKKEYLRRLRLVWRQN